MRLLRRKIAPRNDSESPFQQTAKKYIFIFLKYGKDPIGNKEIIWL
jgi:hypothetical protein